MEGSATFAIANGRLATAATRMRVPSTIPALAGADESPAAAAPPAGFAGAAVADMVRSLRNHHSNENATETGLPPGNPVSAVQSNISQPEASAWPGQIPRRSTRRRCATARVAATEQSGQTRRPREPGPAREHTAAEAARLLLLSLRVGHALLIGYAPAVAARPQTDSRTSAADDGRRLQRSQRRPLFLPPRQPATFFAF